jgi:hypothetical protein
VATKFFPLLALVRALPGVVARRALLALGVGSVGAGSASAGVVTVQTHALPSPLVAVAIAGWAVAVGLLLTFFVALVTFFNLAAKLYLAVAAVPGEAVAELLSLASQKLGLPPSVLVSLSKWLRRAQGRRRSHFSVALQLFFLAMMLMFRG